MQVKIYKKSEDIKWSRAYKNSSGLDIYPYLNEKLILLPGEYKLINTGLFLEIPEGFEGQLRSRSGLALNGVIVLNSPATIDSNYRGELKILLVNLGINPFMVENQKLAIAQLTFNSIIFPEIEIVNSLNNLTPTERNTKGFGSSDYDLS